MQIDDKISNYISISNNDTTRPAGPKKEDLNQKAVTEDQAIKVDISSSAAEKADDAARLERLNAIRKQLAEGTYNISGKDVAEKILKVLKN